MGFLILCPPCASLPALTGMAGLCTYDGSSSSMRCPAITAEAAQAVSPSSRTWDKANRSQFSQGGSPTGESSERLSASKDSLAGPLVDNVLWLSVVSAAADTARRRHSGRPYIPSIPMGVEGRQGCSWCNSRGRPRNCWESHPGNKDSPRGTSTAGSYT